ncbi:MAG: glutamine-hydrolyzing carbamoyl-phosphate synthase small subunit [Candidatus Margulisiibacteriota bacterium]
MHAVILLEDGTEFLGVSFGAPGEAISELVFNTSMTGYQEILTDPSYYGQFVTMTYPLIGNYGVNEDDNESRKPFLSGMIVKEACKVVSNYRATASLQDFMKKHNLLGVEGVDTRAITKHIREKGAMKTIISTKDFDKDSLMAKLKAAPDIVGRDLVKDVTIDKKYDWAEERKGEGTSPLHKVALIDCGVKYNIARELTRYGCKVTIFPASTKADEILNGGFDGVMISNGPGDPEPITYVVDTLKQLFGKIPIFGICLGHQLIGLALGGKTYKLKFGHHGGNHPVKDLITGKIDITPQNHNFCVDMDSLKGQVEVTHINLNDNTVEGLRHKEYPLFSVQYHPESGPGPRDANHLFERFVDLMRGA